MADQKISELTALTGANVADDDAIAIVDTSATETKKIVFSELKNALDTATGFVRITGDTMTGALDVQSTITSDGLTVDGTDTEAAISQLLKVRNSTTGEAVTIGLYAKADNGGDGNSGSITFDAGADGSAANNELRFSADHQTDTNPALSIAGNGDISFYEDTGTTAKFFWDASAERLGIGTSSPSSVLHIRNNDATVILDDGNNGTGGTSYRPHQEFWANGTRVGSIGMTDSSNLEIIADNYNSASINFDTGGSEAMRIDSSGNVGIGTSSPARTLHLNGSDSDTVQLHITNATTGSTSNDGFSIALGSDESGILNMREANPIRFFTSDTERMRIDSSGNVGIGESSVDSKFHVKDVLSSTGVGSSSSPIVIIQNERANTGTSSSVLRFDTNEITGTNQYARAAIGAEYDGSSNVNGRLMFSTADTSGNLQETMRIDSSGNLLVGTTDNTVYNNSGSGTGINLQNFGNIGVARDGNDCMVLNRLNSDGDILVFHKDGSTVGSVGAFNGDLSVGTGDTALRFHDGGNRIEPFNISTNANTDGAVDLGVSGARFKDLYLSGGVYLGGVGSANKLDDYEEGTWTPSLNSGTFSAVGATYTKIGRLVTITLDATVGTGGGSQINNLPFTTGVTTATAMYTSGQNFSSGRTVPIAIVGGGSTILYFRDIGDNVAFAAMPLTAGAGITFNITYYVN